MQYIWKKSGHKRSANTQFLFGALCASMMIIQASMACGFAPQANSPRALAASRTTNCANPMPANNGITGSPAPATPGIVVINEVLSASQLQWNCTASSAADNAWVELYNPQDQPYDLYATRASIDEGPGTQEYLLRFGSIIAAHGFLVVFPLDNMPLSTFTQLSSVRLLINLQVVIDQVALPSLLSDTSYARIPDGSNNWQIATTPTIGSSNQPPVATGPTANAISTKSHTTQQKSSKKQSGSVANDGTGNDSANPGVQPTWNALRLPSSEAANDGTIQQHNSAVFATAPAAPFDFLMKSLLTLLTLLFCAALLWCWRLYEKRRATKARSVYNGSNENTDERKLGRGS
jgi:hypothetical protein